MLNSRSKKIRSDVCDLRYCAALDCRRSEPKHNNLRPLPIDVSPYVKMGK